jgi:hypothetical protein
MDSIAADEVSSGSVITVETGQRREKGEGKGRRGEGGRRGERGDSTDVHDRTERD